MNGAHEPTPDPGCCCSVLEMTLQCIGLLRFLQEDQTGVHFSSNISTSSGYQFDGHHLFLRKALNGLHSQNINKLNNNIMLASLISFIV